MWSWRERKECCLHHEVWIIPILALGSSLVSLHCKYHLNSPPVSFLDRQFFNMQVLRRVLFHLCSMYVLVCVCVWECPLGTGSQCLFGGPNLKNGRVYLRCSYTIPLVCRWMLSLLSLPNACWFLILLLARLSFGKMVKVEDSSSTSVCWTPSAYAVLKVMFSWFSDTASICWRIYPRLWISFRV